MSGREISVEKNHVYVRKTLPTWTAAEVGI